MTNGCKVYICGLESDPKPVALLNEKGSPSGGSAIGYVEDSNPSAFPQSKDWIP